jgi:hypothetical protein
MQPFEAAHRNAHQVQNPAAQVDARADVITPEAACTVRGRGKKPSHLTSEQSRDPEAEKLRNPQT